MRTRKPESEKPPEVGADVTVNRQFLVIVPQDPPTDDKLDKHEVNMAGKSLLPNIMPADWPSVETIANSQRQHLNAATRGRLQRLETANPTCMSIPTTKEK